MFNSESSSHFNALAGLTIYRGDALGQEYRGNAFVGESLRNLIHRRVLEPDGVTFVARRGEEGQEFLASTDPWFHAVNFGTGPDGALYVVDFYRRFVEHPLYVPEGLRNSQPWRTGAEHGRIWRIKPKAELESRPLNSGAQPSSSLRSMSRVQPRKSEIRTPKSEIDPAPRPILSLPSAPALVGQFGNENGWRRDTAQRFWSSARP